MSCTTMTRHSVGTVHLQMIRFREQGGSLNAGIQPFSLCLKGHSYGKASDAEERRFAHLSRHVYYVQMGAPKSSSCAFEQVMQRSPNQRNS